MTNTFVTYWKRQQAIRRRRNQRLTQVARCDLERITQALKDNYGVQRIILFGSLAKGQFTAESDIDLAVAGLAPSDFFNAYAEINRLSRFTVDLKPLEDLHPHFHRRVLAQVEILYEAPDLG
jgi:predicted nucleotidyltransferase